MLLLGKSVRYKKNIYQGRRWSKAELLNYSPPNNGSLKLPPSTLPAPLSSDSCNRINSIFDVQSQNTRIWRFPDSNYLILLFLTPCRHQNLSHYKKNIGQSRMKSGVNRIEIRDNIGMSRVKQTRQIRSQQDEIHVTNRSKRDTE